MASPSIRRWRQLAVWLHVISSVAWLTQAMTLCVLLSVSLTAADQSVRVSATSMAELLDSRLLAPMGNASAFTGFMLAAATAWGFFRHWWVLVKFVITVVQLNLGIFVLSDNLHAAAAAARAGTVGPTGAMVVGSALMAGAIAFQAWLSIAKPWSMTRWAAAKGRPRASAQTAPRWVFAATVLGGLFDLTVSLIVGNPAPLASLIILTVWLIMRWRRQRVGVLAATT